jgi:tRNA threonylcarbamoyladenosine biosynthesis protein TsaE
MKVKYLTTTPRQTQKLGEILAKEVLKTKLKKGSLILGLEGDLGGGKTTFLQGFAKGLGIKEKILSPTFIILKKFKIRSTNWRTNFKNFYHIDCYRIEKPREILALGFKEIVSNLQNVIAVEWADRIRKILPEKVIIIKFQFVDKTKRKISLTG